MGKYGPERTPYLDTFHAMHYLTFRTVGFVGPLGAVCPREHTCGGKVNSNTNQFKKLLGKLLLNT